MLNYNVQTLIWTALKVFSHIRFVSYEFLKFFGSFNPIFLIKPPDKTFLFADSDLARKKLLGNNSSFQTAELK